MWEKQPVLEPSVMQMSPISEKLLFLNETKLKVSNST